MIKDAINYVSSVRGDLGAYQNRLDHTANNLSVRAAAKSLIQGKSKTMSAYFSAISRLPSSEPVSATTSSQGPGLCPAPVSMWDNRESGKLFLFPDCPHVRIQPLVGVQGEVPTAGAAVHHGVPGGGEIVDPQSAQAMLAQANQVPQGVLQLLG